MVRNAIRNYAGSVNIAQRIVVVSLKALAYGVSETHYVIFVDIFARNVNKNRNTIMRNAIHVNKRL